MMVWNDIECLLGTYWEYCGNQLGTHNSYLICCNCHSNVPGAIATKLLWPKTGPEITILQASHHIQLNMSLLGVPSSAIPPCNTSLCPQGPLYQYCLIRMCPLKNIFELGKANECEESMIFNLETAFTDVYVVIILLDLTTVTIATMLLPWQPSITGIHQQRRVTNRLGIITIATIIEPQQPLLLFRVFTKNGSYLQHFGACVIIPPHVNGLTVSALMT